MKKKEKNAERDGPEKLAKDWSAEERFVNRSKKIRKRIREYMFLHAGERYETSGILCDECANFAKCSSITAYRWIHQYSAPSGEFLISETENYLTIEIRNSPGKTV